MNNGNKSLSICELANCTVEDCPVATCPVLKSLYSVFGVMGGVEAANKTEDGIADDAVISTSSEKEPTAKPALTARQLEVLWALVNGYSTKETASLLGISPFTVRAHLSSLSMKLGIKKKYEIIKYGVVLGLCGAPLSKARDLDAESQEIAPELAGPDPRLSADTRPVPSP